MPAAKAALAPIAVSSITKHFDGGVQKSDAILR